MTRFPPSAIPDPECGNDEIESGEECDGPALDGQTCQDYGFTGGTLICTQACTVDVIECTGGTCGDSICQTHEGESQTDCPADCDWKQLDGGEKHSCGVREDDRVWCWGRNETGQLGTGDITPALTPALVTGLDEVHSVSATWGHHSCALRLDTTVWCWGENLSGELGTGDLSPSLVPAQVVELSGVAEVSAGKDHTCVLKEDETVWCWGANDKGQLGTGTLEPYSLVPVQVSNLTGVIELSAGKEHNCARTSDNALYCWGENTDRQSDPTGPADVLEPQAVAGVTNVAQVSAGGRHTCALLSDQTVWCWGENHRGQIGIGSVSEWEPPSQVQDLTSVVTVRTGESVVCALRQDQSVVCWGENNHGQLGNDDLGSDASAPVPVQSLSSVSELTGGKKYFFARSADGEIRAWGENDLGQLGDGTVNDQPVPVLMQD